MKRDTEESTKFLAMLLLPQIEEHVHKKWGEKGDSVKVALQLASVVQNLKGKSEAAKRALVSVFPGEAKGREDLLELLNSRDFDARAEISGSAAPLFLAPYGIYPNIASNPPVHLVKISKFGMCGNIMAMVTSDPYVYYGGAPMSSYGISVFARKGDSFSIQRALQSVFDELLLGIKADEPKAGYLAALAGIAFSPPMSGLGLLLNRIGALFGKGRLAPIGKKFKGVRAVDDTSRCAMDLLNEAYERETGLSYGQILEPFDGPA